MHRLRSGGARPTTSATSCAGRRATESASSTDATGEWEGIIDTIASRHAAVRLSTQTSEQTPAPDVQLLFAPLKATRTRFVVEKATEVGVGAIHPILTRYGQTTRVNTERLRAHAIEAAEQCGRLDVPTIGPPCPLADALAAWQPERRLLVCDPDAESSVAEALADTAAAPWAILIGPEGGFAPDERRSLTDHPAAVHARLGPRILRAETAVAAALTCFSDPRGRLAMRPRCANRSPAMSTHAVRYAGQRRPNRGNPAQLRRDRWEKP